MSKLSKFIDHPEWFFADAFKRRKDFLEDEINRLNKLLGVVGLTHQLDIVDVERKFIQAALFAYEQGNLPEHIVAVINIKNKMQPKVYTKNIIESLNQVKVALTNNSPHIVFKTTFEVAINPVQNNQKYLNLANSSVDSLSVNESEQLKMLSGSTSTQEPSVIATNAVLNNINIPENLSGRQKYFYSKLVSVDSLLLKGII